MQTDCTDEVLRAVAVRQLQYTWDVLVPDPDQVWHP
eukprot:COSAG01_NODE_51662_length_353_cov_0.582677_1_plen_35_part_10